MDNVFELLVAVLPLLQLAAAYLASSAFRTQEIADNCFPQCSEKFIKRHALLVIKCYLMSWQQLIGLMISYCFASWYFN